MQPSQLPVAIDAEAEDCPICERAFADTDQGFVTERVRNSFGDWVLQSFHAKCYVVRESALEAVFGD